MWLLATTNYCPYPAPSILLPHHSGAPLGSLLPPVSFPFTPLPGASSKRLEDSND
jgi:hypothetical protein